MGWQAFIVGLAEHTAWPAVVLISVVLLRKQIPKIVRAIKSLKAGPFEAEFNPPGQPQGTQISKAVELEKFMPSSDKSGMRSELENLINNQLTEIEGKEDQVKVLVSNLAKSQLEFQYMDVYRTIYGSQILLLDDLNVLHKVSLSKATEYYEAAKNLHPAMYTQYTFEQYIGYMIGAKLVKRVELEIAIDKKGLAFLVWLAEVGYSKARPG